MIRGNLLYIPLSQTRVVELRRLVVGYHGVAVYTTPFSILGDIHSCARRPITVVKQQLSFQKLWVLKHPQHPTNGGPATTLFWLATSLDALYKSPLFTTIDFFN